MRPLTEVPIPIGNVNVLLLSGPAVIVMNAAAGKRRFVRPAAAAAEAVVDTAKAGVLPA